MEKRMCSNPSCELDASKKCSKCHVTLYCSKDCQINHWKIHKKICKELSQGKYVKSYKCVEIPGKGFGMVATRDILYGELIIQEKPIIKIKGCQRGEVLLKKKLNELLIQDKNKMMSLYDKHSPKSLVGVFNTNALQAGADSPDSVLCYEISRFNHSCLSNVSHAFVEPNERMYAIKNIKSGTELCTAYILPWGATRVRQVQLQEKFGFTCACSVCLLPTDKQVVRDRKLNQYSMLDEQIGSVFLDTSLRLQMVQEVLDILTDVDLISPALRSRHCYDGFQLACSLGNERKAKKWIKEAYDGRLIENGPDDAVVIKWRAYFNPRLHPAWRSR